MYFGLIVPAYGKYTTSFFHYTPELSLTLIQDMHTSRRRLLRPTAIVRSKPSCTPFLPGLHHSASQW